MGMSKKLVIVVGLALVALAVALPVALAARGEAQQNAKTHTIYLSAVEWKGSASVAKEPYPGPVPPGGGYESCPPGSDECDLKGDTTKWAIETYRFDSAMVAAYVGERVVLQIFGVNSAKHDIVVPAFKKTFTVKRGVVSRTDLGVMKKAGIYKVICVTHPPSHQLDLLVLPKP
jgi:plastocyanin